MQVGLHALQVSGSMMHLYGSDHMCLWSAVLQGLLHV